MDGDAPAPWRGVWGVTGRHAPAAKGVRQPLAILILLSRARRGTRPALMCSSSIDNPEEDGAPPGTNGRDLLYEAKLAYAMQF